MWAGEHLCAGTDAQNGFVAGQVAFDDGALDGQTLGRRRLGRLARQVPFGRISKPAADRGQAVELGQDHIHDFPA